MTKWPKCTWSYSCNSSQPASVASWGILYYQLTEKVKTQACFTGGSTRKACTISEWIAATQYLCETLMESGEEKSFKWVELQSVHLVVHFSWKDKWSKRIYTDSLPKPMVLTGWSGSWNEHDWKLRQESLWRRCVQRPLWKVRWCKNIWVSCGFSLRGDLLTWKF